MIMSRERHKGDMIMDGALSSVDHAVSVGIYGVSPACRRNNCMINTGGQIKQRTYVTGH